MIKSWGHKELTLFYETGSTTKIQEKHGDKNKKITKLNNLKYLVETIS